MTTDVSFQKSPAPARRYVGWGELIDRCSMVRRRILHDLRRKPSYGLHVFGVPRGGCALAPIIGIPVDEPEHADAIVDDVIESGRTRERWAEQSDRPFYALFDKQDRSDPDSSTWLSFPWERDEPPAGDAVVRILEAIGEDPNREGLLETPARVMRAWSELTEGYGQDPKQILSATFDAGVDEMVSVRGIEFWSVCEHHMLPFRGHASVAYIPNGGGRVVGLSKIPRLVHCFARRLQLQERMTMQIAQAIEEAISPLGVGVTVTAAHTCMAMRGVRSGGEMRTTSLLGVFRSDPAVRAEFFAAVAQGRSD